jgi:hypothetical protein
MKRLIATAAALAAVTTTVAAQTPTMTPELRPFVGASIPTGDQRDLFKDATVFGLQAAVEIQPTFHLLGTFAWVPGVTKYTVAEDKVQIFQYDVGAELGFALPLSPTMTFKPFAGLGAGARTFDYKADELATKTGAVGYGAIGSEIQFDRIGLRCEARDNVFSFRSPMKGVDTKTRNDLRMSFGFAYHFR